MRRNCRRLSEFSPDSNKMIRIISVGRVSSSDDDDDDASDMVVILYKGRL